MKQIKVVGAIGNTERQNRDDARVLHGGVYVTTSRHTYKLINR